MVDPSPPRPPAELPAVRLDPPQPGARTFEAERAVRFGDVDRRGLLRLDAMATYLQDVAGDDTADVGVRDIGAWVVRRSVFEVARPPAYGQRVRLITWASGAGSRWAERRLTATAPGDARVEAVSLWVYVDPTSLRPVPLDDGFQAVYGPAVRGRVVSSRLSHPVRPPEGADVDRRPWALRAADIDPYGHVNNAATWAIVEEVLADHPVAGPLRAELEYRAAMEPGNQIVTDVHATGDGVALWVRDAGTGTLFATGRVFTVAG
jgi:acyl-ACP thioesterase